MLWKQSCASQTLKMVLYAIHGRLTLSFLGKTLLPASVYVHRLSFAGSKMKVNERAAGC